MKLTVHHDSGAEERQAKLRWFASLPFEERFRQIEDHLGFLLACGASKPAWGEEARDATEPVLVVRRPGST